MTSDLIRKARDVFDIEIEALRQVRDSLGDDFVSLVKRCIKVLDGGGKIVLSGVGKSGHIGHKIAATLSSTGSPAVFMHPVEGLHGDLGILQKNDLLMALSYSGESDEIITILPPARRLGVFIAAVTGVTDSRLAKCADLTINMSVSREACPFNLAPTASTTALLALGDALAMTLLDARGFTKKDYGRLHPGGAIGRAVTLLMSDIMRPLDKIAAVGPGTTVKDCLIEMTRARCGSAAVVDGDGRLLGIFTDGDFRRHVRDDLRILEAKVSSVMTVNPVSLKAGSLAVEALRVLEKKRIDDIIVIGEDGRVAGLVDVQDLPGLKLM
jgi:arabinose-5-phosphate isomerase